MNATFNVLEQGWIPVITLDGESEELGILQTLARAHELREISHASPLQEYSLYRFLGIFLMDALRPKKKSSIRSFLRDGKFDMEQISRYIAVCQSEGVSFDLFDEKRPFLQSVFSDGEKSRIKPVSKLDCTIPRETSHTHFDHRDIKEIVFSPAEALRLLLASYTFCVADGSGYYYNVYGAPPLFGVIKGSNLFETLISCLLPLDSIGICFDKPPVFWRSITPVESKKLVGQVSWLQGMQFPARKVQLIPNSLGLVSQIYFFSGEKFENPDSWHDPYVSYTTSSGDLSPLLPVKEDALWRNICDIIDIPNQHASKLLLNYQTIHGSEETVTLTLYGVLAKKGEATYYSVCRYDLSLPLKLSNPTEVDLLKSSIAGTQRLLNALSYAIKCVGVIPDSVSASTVRKYEKNCEQRFWKLCRDLCADSPDYSKLYASFCKELSDLALKSYDGMLAALQLRARDLLAAEEKRGYVLKTIKELQKGVVI